MVTGAATRGYDDARAQLQQARTMLDSLQNKIWPAHINSNLGYAAIVAGDYGYARLTLKRALIDARPLWGPGLEGQIEGRLGLLDLLEGRKAEARWHLGRALAVLRSVGKPGVCARHSLPSLH